MNFTTVASLLFLLNAAISHVQARRSSLPARRAI